MSKNQESKLAEGQARVEMVWDTGEDVPTVYANQLVITHAGPEFYLIFGEVIPIGIKNPTDVPKRLTIRPRIRIAISREIMDAFVHVIDDNFARFQKRIEEEAKQNDSNPIVDQSA